MDTTIFHYRPAKPSLSARLRASLPGSPTSSAGPLVVTALVGVITLLALFYAEENWRGQRAWQECQRELAAKGGSVDWNALIPPPVADDQNFFAAPKMAAWFVGRGANDLSRRLAPENFGAFLRQR